MTIPNFLRSPFQSFSCFARWFLSRVQTPRKLRKHPERFCKDPEKFFEHPENFCTHPDKLFKHPEKFFKHPENLCKHPDNFFNHPERFCKDPEKFFYNPESLKEFSCGDLKVLHISKATLRMIVVLIKQGADDGKGDGKGASQEKPK
jgi:hypothetical protein